MTKLLELEERIKQLSLMINNQWNNQACLGYAILSAEKIGLSSEQIKELIAEMNWQHDMKTLEEASQAYRNSKY